MSQKRTTGDHAVRTMTLLWRSQDGDSTSKTPGPKPKLTVDDIVEAGIAVADTNRTRDVAMRAVAERLGVTAMTLYGYVPSKDALVALMYDEIHAEMADHRHREGGWRQEVTTWAEHLVDLYVRHPWAFQVSYARPVLGPHEQNVLETVVVPLRDTHLPPKLMRRVIGLLFHVVRGTALTIAEGRLAAEASGATEGEWWQQSSNALSSVVPDFAERFPNTMWLLSEGIDTTSTDDSSSYVDRQAMANLRVGLDVLLDGVEVARRSVGA